MDKLALVLFCLLVITCGGAESDFAEYETEEISEPEPQIPECHTHEELFEFLENTLNRTEVDKSSNMGGHCDGRVKRWTQAPTLRIAEGVHGVERTIVILIVDTVNQALPDEYQIRIGTDAPPRQPEAPHGEIWMDFAPTEEWKGVSLPTGLRPTGVSGLAHFSPDDSEITWAHIWSLPYEAGGTGYFWSMSVVAHELLHTLGMCHVEKWGGQSVMSHHPIYPDIWEQIPGYIDLDALKAIYAHDIGDYPSFGYLPEQLCAFKIIA